MELLKSELSMILGEPISRVEPLSHQPQSCLFALYDQSGQAMPMAVRCFTRPGLAEQEARKLMLLRDNSQVRVPSVYAVVVSERRPFHELLLLERLGGISLEAPIRSSQHCQQLTGQVAAALRQWHQQPSQGLSGYVDSSQPLNWSDWFSQYSAVLFSLLRHKQQQGISAEDRQFLFQTRDCHRKLFADLQAPNVMVHGNLQLSTLLKDPRTEQLLAIVQPGRMLWAPAEYDLFRLQESHLGRQIVSAYLSQAEVDEGFVWRNALYRLWYQVELQVHNQPFCADIFRQAKADLLPWLE
ncbi:phosphotransferase [Tatumella saanichensis]|uniref:phosphotransferase n=1 Tax=Tatumella saanichensis TaxID=480813 RepID=UPI0004A3B88D|nr:phosphotransferase [Tatumella saanichensis]